jgi:glycosyltransferase involved in cell wall biosynthesis
MKISAVIIAGTEEQKIGDAIRSVGWADEVLVIDSESSDRTRETSTDLGAKVVVRPWEGFSKQKQFGVDTAQHDWIFSLDADERVSPELQNEIKAIRDSPQGPAAEGYRIPRLSYYMGRAIRHSGWYPDRQLRLFDRRRAKWSDVLIHESVTLSPGATAGELKGEIIHYSMDNAAHHNTMIGERYAPLAARQMHSQGRKTSALKVAAAGPIAFIRTYFLKAGFMDGLPGFCIARFAAHHAFLKHLYLLELQMKKSDG